LAGSFAADRDEVVLGAGEPCRVAGLLRRELQTEQRPANGIVEQREVAIPRGRVQVQEKGLVAGLNRTNADPGRATQFRDGKIPLMQMMKFTHVYGGCVGNGRLLPAGWTVTVVMPLLIVVDPSGPDA